MFLSVILIFTITPLDVQCTYNDLTQTDQDFDEEITIFKCILGMRYWQTKVEFRNDYVKLNFGRAKVDMCLQQTKKNSNLKTVSVPYSY